MASRINKANVLGAAAALSFAFGPVPQSEANTPCPKPKNLNSISPKCHDFLMSKLRYSVFDDVSNPLAVVTYQKLAPGNLDRDGIIGPITGKSILQGKGLHPASPEPDSKHKVAHIDKSQQVMYMIQNGVLKRAFSISSGTEERYVDYDDNGNKLKGTADTPIGNYEILTEHDGEYEAPLGRMPYAHFFELEKIGLAIHSGVVDYDGRGSHGCIRASPATMEKFIGPGLRIGDDVNIVA